MSFLKSYNILGFLLVVNFSIYAQNFKEENNFVVFEDNGSSIIAKIGGKPSFQYNYETQRPDTIQQYYQRSGFIHPIYSPDGEILTEGFPEKHTHHHGMFTAWVNTKFRNKKIDFWNQHDETGNVIFKEILEIKSNKDFGVLKTKQHHIAFINGDTIPVLEEIWNIKLYNFEAPFVWDITISQKNISSSVLQLLKYHYGGLAFRGRDEWNTEKSEPKIDKIDNDFQVTTNVHKSRLEANHTIPKWVNMYGKIADNEMNLTIIPRSNNPKFPDYLRVHPDLPYFCFTPVVNNGFDLKPTEIFTTKYRIITSTKTLSEEMITTLANKEF